MRPRRRASARCATSSIWPARRSRSWRGGSRSCASRRRSASRPSSTRRRSTRWRRKLDELRRARDQTQARIAFLEGPPDTGAPAPASAPAPDDTAGVQDRAKNLERIARELEGTLFSITHEGSERIIAEHERRVAEIEALRARDGSNAQQVDQLIAQSAAVRDAQLSQLRAKEVEAAEKVRAANERVVASLEAERAGAGPDRARAVRRPGAEPALGRSDGAAAARGRAARGRAVRRAAGAPGAPAAPGRGPLGHRPDPDGDRAARGRDREAERAARSGRDRSGDLRPCGGGRERPRAPLEPGVDRRRHEVPEGLRGREQRRGDRHRAGVRECVQRCRGLRWSASSATGKLEFQSLADSILADLARDTSGAPDHHGPRWWRPARGTRSATSTGPRRAAGGMSRVG